MLGSERGSFTMELVALISVLCIAAIFIFSHLARQADGFDIQAQKTAELVAPAAAKYFTDNPQGSLTAQALAGLKLDQAIKIEVPLGHDQAEGWEVVIWHPEGQFKYVVSASGVAEKPL